VNAVMTFRFPQNAGGLCSWSHSEKMPTENVNLLGGGAARPGCSKSRLNNVSS
jgi:hypothetical protein